MAIFILCKNDIKINQHYIFFYKLSIFQILVVGGGILRKGEEDAWIAVWNSEEDI